MVTLYAGHGAHSRQLAARAQSAALYAKSLENTSKCFTVASRFSQERHHSFRLDRSHVSFATDLPPSRSRGSRKKGRRMAPLN